MSIEKDSPSIGSDELNVDEFAGEETYSAPAQKSMKEIIETDNNDESLRKLVFLLFELKNSIFMIFQRLKFFGKYNLR